MGDKDLTEKILLDYNDIFADIINVLIFAGEQRVKAEDLESLGTHAQYKADDGCLHEEERDVAKLWKNNGISFAICGIENQSKPDKYMPYRIIGYDGASYKSQLCKCDDRNKVVPVVTLVLYYGAEHWNQPKSIHEQLDVPDELKAFVNDYKANVFEISWLTEKQVSMFRSDFRIVADFLVKKRTDADHAMENQQRIKYVDSMLKFLSVMTGDRRYEQIGAENVKEVHNMCDVAERLEQRGLEEGLEKGLEKGQDDLIAAIKMLREGISDTEILEKGISQKTLDRAKTVA